MTCISCFFYPITYKMGAECLGFISLDLTVIPRVLYHALKMVCFEGE